MAIHNLTDQEILILQQIGITVVDPERKYWFVRTDGGAYFDDFYFGNYVGIQWNDIPVHKDSTPESLDDAVQDALPDESRHRYIANQIYRFAFQFKKGDIVLIPSEGSKYIAFGEILEDDMYIEMPLEELTIDSFFADPEEAPRLVYQKRRKVRWLKTTPREDLDPYLQTFIYAHNTIVDLNSYALFIDRSLSDFYVKGDLCYFSFKVNRKENIPYSKMLHLLMTNQKIVEYMNSYMTSCTSKCGQLSLDEFSIKINVQSKGPVQLIGPLKKLLVFGLVSITLLGGKVSLSLSEQSFEFETEGILPVLQEVHSWLETPPEPESPESNAKEEIEAALEETTRDLELTAPALED